jgi:nucleoporin NUP82
VGTTEYTPHSSPIVKAEWHPLGESFSTLLVLTQDTVLRLVHDTPSEYTAPTDTWVHREYDVNSDLTEPQQSISFLPKIPSEQKNKRRRGAFGIDAHAASTAVSFTIGCGQADWGPLTLYGLMSNGDVWAICPYLPKRS